jgi:hypothetical protein
VPSAWRWSIAVLQGLPKPERYLPRSTLLAAPHMSALPPIATAKAVSRKGDVCSTPESGHVRCNYGCPLWANSGHAGSSGERSTHVFLHHSQMRLESLEIDFECTRNPERPSVSISAIRR